MKIFFVIMAATVLLASLLLFDVTTRAQVQPGSTANIGAAVAGFLHANVDGL